MKKLAMEPEEPQDIITMEQFFDFINKNAKGSNILISNIESSIMRITLLENTTNTSTIIASQPQVTLFFPLLNSKNLTELKKNIKIFCFDFFKHLTIKPKSPCYNQIKAVLAYFKELKQKQILIANIPNKTIQDIFTILPSFVIDFINLFEYNELITSDILQVAFHINSIIAKNEMTLSTILQYMLKITSYYKEKNKEQLSIELIKDINQCGLFELFFNDDLYYRNMDTLSSLLSFYPHETEGIVTRFIDIKQIRNISKLIIKDDLFKYIDTITLQKLKLQSKAAAFYFHYNRFCNNETYLITIYDLFKDEPEILLELSFSLMKADQLKVSQLISDHKYTEADDIEFENSEHGNQSNIYLKLDLPKENVQMISKEEDVIFLEHFKDSEYIGVDTEWWPKITLFDAKTDECSLLQIADKQYVAIIDVLQLRHNQSFLLKFSQVFKGKTFLGFAFENDLKVLPNELREFFVKETTVIDLNNVYTSKYKKKCPDLKTLCLTLFNKELNKKNQISNWSMRPLRDRQIEYAALDAYILLSIYDSLK